MAEQQPLQQMPIFSKSYDMLVWLLQVTQHFPRANRHDYTKRLLDAAFDFRECLEIANLGKAQKIINHFIGCADDRRRIYRE